MKSPQYKWVCMLSSALLAVAVIAGIGQNIIQQRRNSDLITAVKNQDAGAVARLLAAGADANAIAPAIHGATVWMQLKNMFVKRLCKRRTQERNPYRGRWG